MSKLIDPLQQSLWSLPIESGTLEMKCMENIRSFESFIEGMKHVYLFIESIIIKIQSLPFEGVRTIQEILGY